MKGGSICLSLPMGLCSLIQTIILQKKQNIILIQSLCPPAHWYINTLQVADYICVGWRSRQLENARESTLMQLHKALNLNNNTLVVGKYSVQHTFNLYKALSLVMDSTEGVHEHTVITRVLNCADTVSFRFIV